MLVKLVKPSRNYSLNCRGLRGLKKEKNLLNYFKPKIFSIYLLQDTHLAMEDYNQIRSLWGFEIFYPLGSQMQAEQ